LVVLGIGCGQAAAAHVPAVRHIGSARATLRQGVPSGVLVGSVPVVIKSAITLYFDATATVQGRISTGVQGSGQMTSGVGWTRRGGFYPIGAFDGGFGFTFRRSVPPDRSTPASCPC
jgi:hypothetical protein